MGDQFLGKRSREQYESSLSSREASPERLQQLQRKHGLPTEQEDKGKDRMPEETQDRYNQAAIYGITKERGKKTSSGSETPLGDQDGLQGDKKHITLDNIKISIKQVIYEYEDKYGKTFVREINDLLKNINEGEKDLVKEKLECWSNLNLQLSDTLSRRQLKLLARYMLEENN